MAVGLAVGLAVGWAVGSAVGLAVGLAVGNAGLGHPFSLASSARSAEKILQRWSRSPVRSDWVTRFLWYLARAARRKFCPSYNRSPVFSGIWRAQRGENFAFATLARAARRKILQAMNLQKTQW